MTSDGEWIPKFQSTPSAWRETFFAFHNYPVLSISIHSLRMEGDEISSVLRFRQCYFNPLPPHGGRPARSNLLSRCSTFQSTPSAWRETEIHATPTTGNVVFQSTPSAWRETQDGAVRIERRCISIHSLRMEGDGNSANYRGIMEISIHSLRMEGDRLRASELLAKAISIHSLRMEGDGSIRVSSRSRRKFQSTPSAWRETFLRRPEHLPGKYFNPLPPHGGRPQIKTYPVTEGDFNPLPPHGGRRIWSRNICFKDTFQSTPSAWRETIPKPSFPQAHQFQSTPSAWRETQRGYNWNPEKIFQSTPSAWRETVTIPNTITSIGISIHSLRMEGDMRRCRRFQPGFHFNPLPPHGGRPELTYTAVNTIYISIHSLRMEGDRRMNPQKFPPVTFQSTPSAWRETALE